MATVHDVAACILQKRGPMTAMKLQKLCYYAQAWSLVWDDRPIFEDRIEAWANGPVAPSLYRQHAGHFTVDADIVRGAPESLSADEIETIESVLAFYGDKSGLELSEITHAEAPWRGARGSLPAGARSNTEITKAAMAEYYGSLI